MWAHEILWRQKVLHLGIPFGLCLAKMTGDEEQFGSIAILRNPLKPIFAKSSSSEQNLIKPHNQSGARKRSDSH